MEGVLALQSTRFVVITNVAGIQDKTGEFRDRVFHVSLLSEILRTWTQLPDGTRILLVLDEPESNLRGGSTSGLKAYQDFRYMTRKLGIAKIELWHSIGEQYKSIREDDSDRVYRIQKDSPSTFDFTKREKGEAITQRVEGVPQIAKLAFATHGMGSIDIDVNMAVLIRRIAKITDMKEMKREVQAALDNAQTYRKAYRDPDALRAEEAAAQEAREADFLQQIMAHPARFRTPNVPGFDAERVRRAFSLTYRNARHLALRAWQEHNQPVQTESDEELVQKILKRRKEFLLNSKRGFDRSKIQSGLKVSFRRARALAELANQKAKFA